MRHLRQVILGFLAALLSAAVILGSLSLSLSESGLKLAMQSTPTPTLGPGLGQITKTIKTATALPGETSAVPFLTPPIIATFTPMYSFAPLSTPPPSCPPPDGWSPVLIEADDTLDRLAQLYNATPEALIQANCLVTEDLIPGTILYVPGLPPTESPIQCGPPPGWIFYTVRPRDTLYHIGLDFSVSVAELQFANCFGSSTLIRVGQRIFVPNRPTRTPVVAPTQPLPVTATPSNTLPASPTNTPIAVPSFTNTPVIPATSTPTPVITVTPAPSTHTSTPAPSTHTSTPRPTDTSTAEPPSPTPTPTPTDTLTPTGTSTPSPTETPTDTPGPTSTETSSPTPTAIPTNTPSNTPEPPTLTTTPKEHP